MTDTASSPGGDAQAGIVKWNKKQRLNRKVQPLLFLCRCRIFRYPFPSRSLPVFVPVFVLVFASRCPAPGTVIVVSEGGKGSVQEAFGAVGRWRPFGFAGREGFCTRPHSLLPGLPMRTSSEHRATSVAGGFSGLSVLQAVPFPATFRSAGFTPSGGADNR